MGHNQCLYDNCYQCRYSQVCATLSFGKYPFTMLMQGLPFVVASTHVASHQQELHREDLSDAVVTTYVGQMTQQEKIVVDFLLTRWH